VLSSPIAAARSWLQREITFTAPTMRIIVCCVAVAQIAKGLSHEVNDFVKSYWLVDYSAGFVRRGLAGEILRSITGANVGEPDTVAAGYVIAAVTAVAVLLLLLRVMRRGGPHWAFLALLLAGSPFVLDQLTYHRRPDQLGFLLLCGAVLSGDWILRHELRPAILGMGFGVLCFVHEGIALYYLPFTAAYLIAIRRAATWRLYAAMYLPSIISSIVILADKPGVNTVRDLRSRASFPLSGPTVFDYLSRTAGGSFLDVREHKPIAIAVMISLGAGLLVAHFFLLRAQGQPGFFTLLRTRVEAPGARAAVAMIMLGYLLTFCIGKDWTRWFCTYGACWLICTTGLASRETHTQGASSPRLRLWTLLALLYLAALPALNEAPDFRGALLAPLYVLPGIAMGITRIRRWPREQSPCTAGAVDADTSIQLNATKGRDT
jgi:hypothetical protein